MQLQQYTKIVFANSLKYRLRILNELEIYEIAEFKHNWNIISEGITDLMSFTRRYAYLSKVICFPAGKIRKVFNKRTPCKIIIIG